MKTPTWLMALLAVTFLAQWAVPASLIRWYEATLAQGRVYKFRTQPVDPYDAFRGRYVALGFADARAPLADPGADVRRGQRLFAALETDVAGFARLARLERRPPAAGDYLAVTVAYAPAPTNVFVQLPFDRFYMNERLAPAAEQAYRERGRQDAWAAVRVLKGRAVIEDLVIAGRPIREFLAARGDR